MGKSIDPMTGSRLERRSEPNAARPGLIVSMSFRLAIPRQVALQQRLLPLHQPPAIVRYTRSTRRGFFIERQTRSYLIVSALGPTPDTLGHSIRIEHIPGGPTSVSRTRREP